MRRMERNERGREREKGRGGEASWNRAADWLRPALWFSIIGNSGMKYDFRKNSIKMAIGSLSEVWICHESFLVIIRVR